MMRDKQTSLKRFSKCLAWFMVGICVTLSACKPAASPETISNTVTVDGEALTRDPTGKNWLAYGRTYNEQRHSPLEQINDGNVENLGITWAFQMPEARSMVATPLVVDGIMYFPTDFSIVYAVDARTGEELWRYDPKVREVGGKSLISWANSKGIAFWKGKVYVGTADGRLIAINASTGKESWSVQTRDDDTPRNISGAPRVFNDKVIIGHGGADFYAMRGYVTAYDAASGELAWRFHTVPGDPEDGFENAAMEMAAKTWNGEWWKQGGGGTAWNAMTYDPEFNRVYIGTGNGSPWNRNIRSPGGGDNLFLSSIVALDADTGEYIWHYQTTPGEEWDYNSAMDMILADLPIDNEQKKVILHAPKNGFFYVIDREDGKLISAEKFAKVTWAERIDLESGRPVETPGSRYEEAPFEVWPSSAGAHSWHPMSYNPKTGLVYIPYIERGRVFARNGVNEENWKRVPYSVNTGLGSTAQLSITPKGGIVAWNPIEQKAEWRLQTSPLPYNGGTLTTAGNLVFMGTGNGQVIAFAANSGKQLWSFDTGWGISAAPITYSIDGEQYLSIGVGFGALAALAGYTKSLPAPWQYGQGIPTMLTFRLGGDAEAPMIGDRSEATIPLDDPELDINDQLARTGMVPYIRNCAICHGGGARSGGGAPDLRSSGISMDLEAFESVVREGALEALGMPKYDHLSEQDVEAIFHYIRQTARRDLQNQRDKKSEK